MQTGQTGRKKMSFRYELKPVDIMVFPMSLSFYQQNQDEKIPPFRKKEMRMLLCNKTLQQKVKGRVMFVKLDSE